MDLTTLFIVGIGIFIIVLAATLITVNRAYKFEHTIDAYPSTKPKPDNTNI